MPNILVADDNPVTLRFFAEALAQIGLTCALASDGVEALAHAQRTRFDMLLFDARMPGLDGTQALARIRIEPGPSRDAVALATTADGSDSIRSVLLTAGFVGVVVKPITIEALRAALARHFNQIGDRHARTAHTDDCPLDDGRALAAVGGDASILAALRGLLVAELDALPAELAGMAARADVAALRDRLHRLDASAGFCGAPALAQASARLRSALDAHGSWPHAAAADFLAVCADVRARLEEAGSSVG